MHFFLCALFLGLTEIRASCLLPKVFQLLVRTPRTKVSCKRTIMKYHEPEYLQVYMNQTRASLTAPPLLSVYSVLSSACLVPEASFTGLRGSHKCTVKGLRLYRAWKQREKGCEDSLSTRNTSYGMVRPASVAMDFMAFFCQHKTHLFIQSYLEVSCGT